MDTSPKRDLIRAVITAYSKTEARQWRDSRCFREEEEEEAALDGLLAYLLCSLRT